METTIIKLTPTDEKGQVTVNTGTDFEEAFGEFSELRGKGRARRQAQRTARKVGKQERKMTVKTAKQDRRRKTQIARKERASNRGGIGSIYKRAVLGGDQHRADQQEAKMGRRERRLAMRQERKDATQTRRDTRTLGKLGRRDAEVLSEQGQMNYEAENEAYRDSLAPEETMDYAQDNQYYEPENQGGYSDDYQDDGSYQEEDMGYNQPVDDGYYEEDSYQETYDEPSYQNEEYYPEDEEYSQEENEFYDDNSNFNAESSDGKDIVSPDVKDTAQKIIWNCRMVKEQLVPRRDMMLKKGIPAVGIQKQIDSHVDRVNELKASLDAYSNADGLSPKEKAKRKREVRSAIGKNKTHRPKQRPIDGGCETPVDSNLNPDFTPNKIVVPADEKSAFNDIDDFDYDTQTENGRPIIFEDDNVENYKGYEGDDYPTARVYELKSNASGGTEKKINWKSIAIGVGVAVTLLYIAKKTKLIK